MKIQTGTPSESGRYVCYLPGVELPTVIRLFIVGHGWCNNLQEPIKGDVAGWIGPLPLNSARPMEFDL